MFRILMLVPIACLIICHIIIVCNFWSLQWRYIVWALFFSIIYHLFIRLDHYFITEESFTELIDQILIFYFLRFVLWLAFAVFSFLFLRNAFWLNLYILLFPISNIGCDNVVSFYKENAVYGYNYQTLQNWSVLIHKAGGVESYQCKNLISYV